MEKSDTENDSDCYESAEEEFEKNEKVVHEKSTSVKTLSESESDVISSSNSFRDAENTVVDVPRKEATKNTVSYRKRPERVKRLDSIPSSKKESQKMEIITTPDAFIQDITMNLSKNLNKGLSTIQQTSSNVKDLIMNSLPVTTMSEKSAFSYDDNDNLAMDVDMDSELCDSSREELVSNELSKCLTESKNKDEQNVKKCIEDEIHDFSTNYELDTTLQEDYSEGLSINESISFDGNENLNENIDTVSDAMNKNPVSRFLDEQHEIESHVSFTESSFESTKSKFDILEGESKDVKHQNEGEESSSQIVKIIEGKDFNSNEDELCQTSTNSVQLSTDDEAGSGIISEEENKEHNTEVNKSLSEYESDDWNESFLKSVNSTEGVDSWTKSDWDDFARKLAENDEENSECDVEALKTSLENIVLQNEGGNRKEIEASKDEFNKSDVEKNVEGTKATQEGWDDFDFSDHELENVDVGSKELEKSVAAPTKEGGSVLTTPTKKAGTVLTTSTKEEGTVLTTPTKEGGKPSIDQKSNPKRVAKQGEERRVESNQNEEKRDKEGKRESQARSKRNVLGAKKLEKAATEKVSQRVVEESKPANNDNWEWDNWDDGAEKKMEKEEPSKKEEIRKDNEINEFEKKWSGWDNFAQKLDENEGNWNLGSWGVNMLLNKASAVTQGISTVLEAGLGAPDPETLARMEKEERLKKPEGDIREKEDMSRKNSNDALMFPVFELTNLVAGVTSKIVDPSKIQEIGSKVISGGLDTLESFGKKTMEVLQEGDPGLRKKRALLLGSNKPVLSQVLREAKEKAEREDRRIEEKELFRKCQFETLFDDYQGMVHLEALEMLSTQCELKLDQMRSSLNPAEQEDMDGILQEVEQLCCLEDFYLDWDSFSNVEFKVSIEFAVESLQEEISLVKIIQIHSQVDQWLIDAKLNKPSGMVVYQKVVSTLAELTAATVHQFHKTGELLTVKECRKTVGEVDALLKMTNVLCAELERLCGKFVDLCETMPEKDSIRQKIETVLNNAVSYIKQAFHLLVPVVQVGAAM